jgi:hypothetical protein
MGGVWCYNWGREGSLRMTPATASFISSKISEFAISRIVPFWRSLKPSLLLSLAFVMGHSVLGRIVGVYTSRNYYLEMNMAVLP